MLICLSVGYICEPCKNCLADRDAAWGVDSFGLTEPRIRWQAGPTIGKDTFGGPAWACPGLPAVDILHIHAHPFNGPLTRTTRVSRYQKGRTIWILLKQETVSGSGISWAVCKSAPRSRQITTTAPHYSVFAGRMPFLPPNQQSQSTEGNDNDILHIRTHTRLTALCPGLPR